jgi:predicted CXXCH cytochrome family protein
MKRSLMMFVIAAMGLGMALALPMIVLGQASPPPFNNPSRSVKMPCAYCHDLHGGNVVTQGTAQVEALCMTCHNGTFTDPVTGATAVEVAPHDNSRSSYGDWKVSCLGCHSPHRNAKAAGSEVTNPPNGYGNWMLIGSRVPEASSTDLLARIRRPVIIDVAGDNNGTGNRRYEDDIMDGYFCSNTAEVETAGNSGAVRAGGVVTITTVTSHRFSLGDSVWIGSVADWSFNGGPFVIASVPTSTTFTFAQAGADATSGGGVTTTKIVDDPGCIADPPNATDATRRVVFYDNRYPGTPALNQWAIPFTADPSAPGSTWYNGACNVCHTRTTHHRRDNSTPEDHGHNVNKACSDCHVHDKGWIK